VVAEREAGRPDRAIDQALAAGAWADAASLIDQIGGEMLERRALDSLGGWIAAVPEAVQEAYPRLSYLRGVIAWESGRGQEAQPLLDRARAGFRARGDREGEGDALAALIKVFARAEAFPRAMTLFDRALELPQRPHNRVDLLLSRSFWALAVGNWAQSIRDLEEAIAVAETTRAPRTLLVLATNFYGNMVFLPGGLAAVDRFQALVETSDDGGPVLRACSAHLAAIAALWRGDWSAAVPIAERALALSDRFDMLLRVEFGTRILLAGCAAITEDAAAADRHCADLLAMLERPAFAPIRTWTGVLLQAVGRVRVLQGRHDEARAVAERIDAEAAAGDWPSTPGGRAILRGLMLQAEGNHQGAEGFFREAKALLRPYPDALWFGDPDLLLAGSRLALGHPNEAVALLAPLLAECDRADTPGRLLWNGPATAAPLLRLAVSRGLHAAFAARVLAQAGRPAS
jgi:tetratricopeptide (TPR) repeat protein